MAPSYAPLSSFRSTSALSARQTDPELSEEERGPPRQQPEDDADGDEVADEAKEGLLGGGVKEEQDGVLLVGKSKSWLASIRNQLGLSHIIDSQSALRKKFLTFFRLSQLSLRSILLCGLAAFSLVLLILLFHPTSALLPSYYHSSTLLPGTFSSSASLAPNPLPPDGKFGDIPFASVGAPIDGDKPAWAGGDDGANRIELAEGKGQEGNGARWNGTHWFDRTVLLVSLDGVRADYLERGLTPHLVGIAKKGLRAEFLKPVFPSLTFPNHYSLITGLYPASHGIVANDFIDPLTGKEFVYTEPTKSWPSEWWGGEPIWSTAVKNGLRSAVLMWPGPPIMADGTKPTQWYPFQNKYHYSRKVEKVASWLDQPRSTRPHIMTVYAPEVDQQGHRTGPDSHGVDNELKEMDDFAKDIWATLAARNLTDVVDVIFVSDHGMTDTHNERLVFLDDILGEEGFKGIQSNEGWPSAVCSLFILSKDEVRLTVIPSRVFDSSLTLMPTICSLGYKTHRCKRTAAFTFTLMTPCLTAGTSAGTNALHRSTLSLTSDGLFRIAMTSMCEWVAITGRRVIMDTIMMMFVSRVTVEFEADVVPSLQPSMHAIFVAHGPMASSIKAVSDAKRKRRHQPSKRDEITVIPGFANLEVYNLVARLLGIDEAGRAPNNGTVGFWEELLTR
ncbi:hypothetical protein P7C70_g6048, partial [Phenoliferia sp. Uapishka_3]